MKKKLFQKSELQRLTACRKPYLSRTTDRLHHALIGHRLLELFGGRVAVGWWLSFEEFIEQAPPAWHQHVAPLCIFTSDRDGCWSAAAVICCSASTAASSPSDRQTAEFLRDASIGFVLVSPADIVHGHHKTAKFAAVVQRAMFPAGEDATYPSATDKEEEFLSEPRPIYPPRSRFIRD